MEVTEGQEEVVPQMETVAESAAARAEEQQAHNQTDGGAARETEVELQKDVTLEEEGRAERGEKKHFELAENTNSQEDTEDESDDEEMEQFLHLMNKAEKKNQKKVSAVQTFQLGSGRPKEVREDWRVAEVDSDTSDTSDEDDTQETARFLDMMGARRREKQMVNIRWQDGRVVGLPQGIKVTRVAGSEEARRAQQEQLIRRRREAMEAARRAGQASTPTSGGKRKFEDRMSLAEAKADDFTDTKDYVDFIQAKLKNVNIKIIK